MSYQVLARKWRPKQFSEVVGQQHIVTALSNALDSDRIHHAFLFTGTRGVGKTTLARIFAKALNCETGVSANPCGECGSCMAVTAGNYIDLIEVDAASRTKVDDTRDLLDNVQYAPTQGRYKVYLIDEVHMLSTHSFNALLKTLEEPPEHVKFLLATTDPQKLPMTILSRCIQFSLNAIEQEVIAEQLARTLTAEKIAYEPIPLSLIARAANGSMRDALSLLDQAIAFGNENVSEPVLREMLGMIDSNQISAIVEGLIAADYTIVQQAIDSMVRKSADYQTALDDLLSMLHAISAYQFSPEAIEWKGLDTVLIKNFANNLSAEELQLYYQIVLHGKRDINLAPDLRTGFEMALLRLFAFTPRAQTKSDRNPSENKLGADVTKTVSQSTETPKVVAEKTEATQEHFVLADKNTQLPPHLTDQHQVTAGKQTPPIVGNKISKSMHQEYVGKESNSVKAAAPQQAISAVVTPAAEADSLSQKVEQASVDLAKLVNNIQTWTKMINDLPLRGMGRQLALHMSPQGLTGGTLTVSLDSKYAQLLNNDRLAAIELQLNSKSVETIKLETQISEVDNAMTAAGCNAKQAQLQSEATRKSFQEDPAVQEMVRLFDATVDVSSIKSVKQA